MAIGSIISHVCSHGPISPLPKLVETKKARNVTVIVSGGGGGVEAGGGRRDKKAASKSVTGQTGYGRPAFRRKFTEAPYRCSVRGSLEN